jgi:hypothetical protein
MQLKHAKVARQLEASTEAEKAATERVEELQEELQDCTNTCRSRMRWLEQAAGDAARRTQQLYRCLQASAPLEVSEMLNILHITCTSLPAAGLGQMALMLWHDGGMHVCASAASWHSLSPELLACLSAAGCKMQTAAKDALQE